MKQGFESRGVRHVTPVQALGLCLGGATLIDVRAPELNRFKTFDVPRVVYCPLDILADRLADLPGERPLIFADSVGLRSLEAVELLKEKGMTDGIFNLAGGLVEWERDGLPLLTDKNERLSGSCMCQLRPREQGK